MQPVSRSEDLDRGKLVIRGRLQSLRHAGRKGEGAAVRQFDDDPPALPIVAH